MSRKALIGSAAVGVMLLAAPAVAWSQGEPPQPEATESGVPEPKGMQSTVLSRFGGDRDADGRIDEASTKRPAELDVFPVAIDAPREACDFAETAVWRVDGERTAPRGSPEPNGGICEVVFAVRGEGLHRVKLLLREPTIPADSKSWVAEITVDDRLVVALGDSVASGEGNPEEGGGWLDRNCHRSSTAGFQQAARRVSEAARATSITFVSLACSGARIHTGLLEPYGGVAPQAGVEYAPQVDRLAGLAGARQPAEEGSPVDAVLVSVAANDVNFQKVVTACAMPGDCRTAYDNAVFDDLSRVARSYEELAAGLDVAAPEAKVLITEYFDPTRDDDGSFCKGSVGLTTREEAEWAYESLLRPLNLEVEIAANRHRWRHVGGIASDYEKHGYCSESPWVQSLGKSVAFQGDHRGTLHPNGSGHTAIANGVAPKLADTLGLELPEKEDPKDGGLSTLEKVGVGLAAALALVALGFLVWLLRGSRLVEFPRIVVIWALLCLAIAVLAIPILLIRLVILALPTNRIAPGPKRKEAKLRRSFSRRSPTDLIYVGLVLLGVAALVVLAAGIIGSAILWVRFWSANLPADQAVDAVSNGELVATGTQGLGLFVVIGLIGLAGAWMLDGAGDWGRATRTGLVTIAVVELVVAVLALGDFRTRQEIEIFIGFVLFALFAYFLLDRSLERAVRKGKEAPRLDDGKPPPPSEVSRGTPKPVWRGILDQLGLLFGTELLIRRFGVFRVILRAVPVALLLFAIAQSLFAQGNDRFLLVLGPYLLAALLFVAPGGVAWKATGDISPDRPDVEALEPPRVALALSGLICVTVLMIRDHAWLAVAATVAVFFAFLCLAIARASGPRFLPYGLAILVSVPLFGASAVIFRGLDSPKLQPVAAVLQDGRAVCGAYIGESDQKLWIGHAELSELAAVRRPDARKGSIESFDSNEVLARSVGPLQPISRANAQALILRERLAQPARGEAVTRVEKQRSFTCNPSAVRERPEPSEGRDLAEQYQPELIMFKDDRFWPIPVQTLFSMRDRRTVACRQLRVDDEEGCIRLTTQGEFPWSGGDRQAIEFPAADDRVDEQADLMTDALGSIDPDRTASEYFLAAQDPKGSGAITLQYWFFYSFNYQPLFGLPDYGGFHEGDFESVAILLSAVDHEPRYIWMARHDKEGRVFPWGDESIRKHGGHPTVFVAKGSHASYERCGRQQRPDQRGEIDDWIPCEETDQLALAPESTSLTDLSRVPWACWRGLFGHQVGGRFYELKHLFNNAPLGPLWQQRYGGVRSEPCRGVEDPGERDGPTEEVISDKSGVPETLRERAGNLEDQVDSCEDWISSPRNGTYLVACNESDLQAYVESGFEEPGDAGVRIDPIRGDRAPDGEFSVPAVGGASNGFYLDDWRIVAQASTTVNLFASCPHDDAILSATFEDVALQPGVPVRISDRDPAGWRLIKEDGEVVDRVDPKPLGSQFKPDEGARLSCSRPGDA